jgi:hypothetical protein
MFDTNGRPVQDRAVSMALSDMKSQVVAALAQPAGKK